MQKITPNVVVRQQCEEAANFYVSVFGNSKVESITRYGEAGPAPKGTVMTVALNWRAEIHGTEWRPALQIHTGRLVLCCLRDRKKLIALWQKLSEGGSVLMELAKYPFSEKFGWVADKYGLSWQLNLASFPQKITPCLMFVGEQNGKAEEAMKFYTSQFSNAAIDRIERYAAGEAEPKAP